MTADDEVVALRAANAALQAENAHVTAAVRSPWPRTCSATLTASWPATSTAATAAKSISSAGLIDLLIRRRWICYISVRAPRIGG